MCDSLENDPKTCLIIHTSTNNALPRPCFWCSGISSGFQIVASIQTWSRSNSVSLFGKSFDFRLFWEDNSLRQKLGLDNSVYQPQRCLPSRNFDWIEFSFSREPVCRETRLTSHMRSNKDRLLGGSPGRQIWTNRSFWEEENRMLGRSELPC
jgi:hypothetical protein